MSYRGLWTVAAFLLVAGSQADDLFAQKTEPPLPFPKHGPPLNQAHLRELYHRFGDRIIFENLTFLSDSQCPLDFPTEKIKMFPQRNVSEPGTPWPKTFDTTHIQAAEQVDVWMRHPDAEIRGFMLLEDGRYLVFYRSDCLPITPAAGCEQAIVKRAIERGRVFPPKPNKVYSTKGLPLHGGPRCTGGLSTNIDPVMRDGLSCAASGVLTTMSETARSVGCHEDAVAWQLMDPLGCFVQDVTRGVINLVDDARFPSVGEVVRDCRIQPQRFDKIDELRHVRCYSNLDRHYAPAVERLRIRQHRE